MTAKKSTKTGKNFRGGGEYIPLVFSELFEICWWPFCLLTVRHKNIFTEEISKRAQSQEYKFKIFYIEQPRVGIPVEAGTPASKHRWRSSLDRSTVAAHRQDTQKSIALHLKKSPTAIQIWDFAADVTDLGCEGVGEWGFVQHGSTLIWLPVPTILQSNVNFSGSEFFTQNPLLVSNI